MLDLVRNVRRCCGSATTAGASKVDSVSRSCKVSGRCLTSTASAPAAGAAQLRSARGLKAIPAPTGRALCVELDSARSVCMLAPDFAPETADMAACKQIFSLSYTSLTLQNLHQCFAMQVKAEQLATLPLCFVPCHLPVPLHAMSCLLHLRQQATAHRARNTCTCLDSPHNLALATSVDPGAGCPANNSGVMECHSRLNTKYLSYATSLPRWISCVNVQTRK